jgi:hypothetical protein
MKHIDHLFVIVAGAVLLAGCASSDPAGEKAKPERGRDGTIAYLVEVVSSEPGVKIEADGSYIGTTPLTLKIFGDKDGTFHNFGSQEYILRAYPLHPWQTVQTKVFRTGGWFSPEDRVPTKVYFDMGPAQPPAPAPAEKTTTP